MRGWKEQSLTSFLTYTSVLKSLEAQQHGLQRMETAVRFAQGWEALKRWGLWSRDGDWARLGTRQMEPKSSGCMAEHMAPAREMLDCEDWEKAVKVSPC